jgi:hypothetical protein
LTQDPHDLNRAVDNTKIDAIDTAYATSVSRANLVHSLVHVWLISEFIESFEKRIEILIRSKLTKLENTAPIDALQILPGYLTESIVRHRAVVPLLFRRVFLHGSSA